MFIMRDRNQWLSVRQRNPYLSKKPPALYLL